MVEFFGTSAKNQNSTSLYVSRVDVDYLDNSVITVNKTTTLPNSPTPFSKERFNTDLTQLSNKLIHIQEVINNSKKSFVTNTKKHTLMVTLTYYEWLKIAQNAEASRHTILRHPYGWAIFAHTTLIDDVFRNVGEEKCTVCNETSNVFYSQWKKAKV